MQNILLEYFFNKQQIFETVIMHFKFLGEIILLESHAFVFCRNTMAKEQLSKLFKKNYKTSDAQSFRWNFKRNFTILRDCSVHNRVFKNIRHNICKILTMFLLQQNTGSLFGSLILYVLLCLWSFEGQDSKYFIYFIIPLKDSKMLFYIFTRKLFLSSKRVYTYIYIYSNNHPQKFYIKNNKFKLN